MDEEVDNHWNLSTLVINMPPFARFAVWILRSIEVFFPRFICAIGMDVRPLLDGTFDYGIFVNILNENQMACIYMYVNGVLMQCSSHTVCLCVILDIHNRDMYWCLSDISTLGVIEFNQPWLSWECVFDIIEFKFAKKKNKHKLLTFNYGFVSFACSTYRARRG